MILLGDESSPRWLRELGRFLPLKNLIFVHGNILDLLAYPVKTLGDGGESIAWTENTVPLFFPRLLTELRYSVVGLYDPVDGLNFASQEMEKIYKQLASGKNSEVSARNPGSPECMPQAQPANITKAPEIGRVSPQAPGRPGAGDLNSVFDGIRTALRNTNVPCAFVFNLASRLTSSPSNLRPEERVIFTKILKSSTECADVYRASDHWKNVMIFICDKLNDLPAFLYLNNPRARSIYIDKPDSIARSRLFKRSYAGFFGVEPGTECPTELISHFASMTDGLTNYELKSLVNLSRREGVPVKQPKDAQRLCERYKYGITESEWDKIDRDRLDRSEEFIRRRIKGQDMAVARVLDIIKRARIGLAAGSSHRSNRPRGVLFFAGPTGVGKTELAKSLAELLFGQEDRCIRFDMSEYASQHADQRLLGAPPGYVGYEEGGQLTTAIREKPFSILLFDEIEKAHGSIFDKFLQILDDGRITDGKGETVYFSESIIIFTSNLGTAFQPDNDEEAMVTSSIPYERMQETVLKAIRDHFNFQLGRPEILNRFGDNFVVFDFIRPPVDEEIIDLLLRNLTESAKENHKINLLIERSVIEKLITFGRQNLEHGGRGLRNMMDSAMVNPLNRALFDLAGFERGGTVRVVDLLDQGVKACYRFELIIESHLQDEERNTESLA